MFSFGVRKERQTYKRIRDLESCLYKRNRDNSKGLVGLHCSHELGDPFLILHIESLLLLLESPVDSPSWRITNSGTWDVSLSGSKLTFTIGVVIEPVQWMVKIGDKGVKTLPPLFLKMESISDSHNSFRYVYFMNCVEDQVIYYQ